MKNFLRERWFDSIRATSEILGALVVSEARLRLPTLVEDYGFSCNIEAEHIEVWVGEQSFHVCIDTKAHLTFESLFDLRVEIHKPLGGESTYININVEENFDCLVEILSCIRRLLEDA